VSETHLDGETQASEPPFVPIAHIAPLREDGSRRALCGAELLGIHAFGEYELCETCVRLHALTRPKVEGPS
jgi:hypothetical protein